MTTMTTEALPRKHHQHFHHNTIIVGGGHAGVNLACMLTLEKPSEDYLILERAGVLLPKWRDSRWEGFQMNTPVKFARLYGQERDGHDTRDEFLLDRPLENDLQNWDEYVDKLGLNYKLHANVVNVTKDDAENDNTGGDGLFHVTVTVVDNSPGVTPPTTTTNYYYTCQNLVVCNGMFDKPKTPKAVGVESLSSFVVDAGTARKIKQHTPAGFKFDHLVPGNILVIGSGQSGCQITDLLVDRVLPNIPESTKVYLSTSGVPGVPRTFLGRDLFQWLEDLKLIDTPRAALFEMAPEKANAMKYSKNPVTGAWKDISPFSLYRKGVTLLGGLEKISLLPEQQEGEGWAAAGDSTSGDETKNGGEDHDSAAPDHHLIFQFRNDRIQNLKVSLAGYKKVRGLMLKSAGVNEADAPAPREWKEDTEAVELWTNDRKETSTLDAREHNITNIIWCTGWSNDFSWLQQVKNAANDRDPRTNAPDVIMSKSVAGLFYLGFPWIGRSQSVNLFRFNPDAKIVMENLIAGASS